MSSRTKVSAMVKTTGAKIMYPMSVINCKKKKKQYSYSNKPRSAARNTFWMHKICKEFSLNRSSYQKKLLVCYNIRFHAAALKSRQPDRLVDGLPASQVEFRVTARTANLTSPHQINTFISQTYKQAIREPTR